MVAWDSKIWTTRAVSIQHVAWFDARGTRRVYERGDHVANKLTFNMDIWRDPGGRLFCRFWSRNADVDGRSMEVIGIAPSVLPDGSRKTGFTDTWIPKTLRQEYERWIEEEI
jgi:hypothetical protein